MPNNPVTTALNAADSCVAGAEAITTTSIQAGKIITDKSLRVAAGALGAVGAEDGAAILAIGRALSADEAAAAVHSTWLIYANLMAHPELLQVSE